MLNGFAEEFHHPWIRFSPLFPPRFFCSWVTAWVKTLSRWAGTDRILVEEFNDNWDKIDTALKGNADAVAAETAAREAGISALQTALAGAGDCLFEVKTYTGNGQKGEANAIRFTFSRQPQLVCITGYGTTAIGVRGCSSALSTDSGGLRTSWSGKTVSWYHDNNYVSHMNNTGSTYTVIALTK